MSPSRIITIVLVVGLAAHARADDVADAKAYYKEGTQLYKAGSYRAAITAFENAYRKKPHGAIHYNIAQCREKLAEWPAALRSYHDYLRELPDAKDRPAVLATMRGIEQKLAATGVQVLLVYTDPLGAEVRIDQKPKGTTPFHIVLPPGQYTVSFSREGYAVASREVTLTASASQVVDVVLRPAVATPVPLPPPPVAAQAAGPDLAAKPPPAASPATVAAPAPKPAAAPQVKKGRVWTWVAAGVSAVALGTAAYYGMHAKSKSDELLDGTVRGAGEAAALADDAESSAKKANIMYGVAAAGAAAGAALFFVEGSF